MFEQSFSLVDVPSIFTLAFLEFLLSADNAVILGLISSSLPEKQRAKALFIGVFSAFFLRAAALLGVAIVIQSIWVQILGGAYLLYLSFRYFTKRTKPGQEESPVRTFWKAVLLIELLDLVFAVDSIIAGVAFINGAINKLWIVYLGGMLGVIGMRYAADLFSKLIDRLPHIERSAYLMVALIGSKLVLSSFHIKIPYILFWSLIALFFLLGIFSRKR